MSSIVRARSSQSENRWAVLGLTSFASTSGHRFRRWPNHYGVWVVFVLAGPALDKPIP